MIQGFKDIYINNLYGIGFILSQLFFSLGLNYLLNPWKCKNKQEVIYKVIELVISVIIIIFISCLFAGYYRFPYYKAPLTVIDLIMMTFTILLVTFNVVIYKKNLTKQASIALLFFCLFTAQSNLGGWFGSCQERIWHVLEGKVEFTLIGNIIGMISIMIFMLKIDFKKFVFIPKTMILLVSGYFLFTLLNLSLFRLYFLEQVFANGTEWVFFAIYVSFIMLSVLVYLMIYFNAKEYNEKMMEQLVIDNNKNYIEMMQMSEDKYDSIRKINHDVKNQFMMLQLLMKEKKYDELEKYVNSYLSTMGGSITNLSHSGNKMLDDILNIAFAKCDKNSIKLSMNAIVPENLNVDPVDLCSLITNLVDNAINAIKSTRKKEISLDVEFINSSLLIKVKNYTNKKFNKSELKSLLRNNSDDNYHGWGLKIVNSIVEKYKGSIELECKNNIFSATALIFVEEDTHGTNN